MAETKIGRSFKLKGKTTSVSVQSDELKLSVDAKKLGKIITEAIAEAASDGVGGISERTADGKRQLFVDSGRLMRGIKAASAGGTDWSVVAPRDRLQDPKLVARLFALVPALSNPIAAPGVSEAINKAMLETVKIKKATV